MLWCYEQKVKNYLVLEKNNSKLSNAADSSSKIKTENYQQFQGHWDLGKNGFAKVVRGRRLMKCL